MRKVESLSLLVAILALATRVDAAGFKVVAHPSVTVDSLSKITASRMFLKKDATWPDGTTAVPVDQPLDTKVRSVFSEAVHQKTVGAVDAFWQKQIFTGRDLPPIVKSGDAEVIAFVKANRGAVGYVSAEAGAEGLKIVEIK